METLKSFLTLRPGQLSAETAAAPCSSSNRLQSQFDAQTARLRETYKVQRSRNTARAYEPKQKEWDDWCAKLEGNIDGARVTEDKLCLFLEEKVMNRESRAPGYQARKATRREMWKDSARANKRQRTSGSTEEWREGKGSKTEEDEWDEKALDALFNETVRYSVVNSYVSAITELYAWQSEGQPMPSLRGAKLSALLENVRRDEDRIRRVNFVDRGLFTITGGYDVEGLRKAVAWCWEAASRTSGSVESYLRTSADHLLGS
jgi:hypothetical protein